MNPIAVRRAIYGKLAGDTTLVSLLGPPAPGRNKAIYYQQAPQKAEYPFVIFAKSSGVPTYAMASKPALESDVWLVKGVDRDTTSDRADAISARLQELLEDADLSISGAGTLYLRRQSDVDYPEDSQGVQFAHAGSLYRLVFEPT